MKRKFWYTVAAFVFLGWIVGDDEPPTIANAKPSLVVETDTTPKLQRVAPEPEAPKARPIKTSARQDTNTPDLRKITRHVEIQPKTAPKPVKVVQNTAPHEILFVTGSRVNVRTAPSIKGNRITQVVQGQKVTVFETQNGWARISVKGQSAKTGWMSAKYLSPKAPVRKATVSTKQIAPKTQRYSNRQIEKARQSIIRQSIARYSGNCPCPYNTKSNGHQCGGNSAYSRPGGASPICYAQDITQAQLNRQLKRQR